MNLQRLSENLSWPSSHFQLPDEFLCEAIFLDSWIITAFVNYRMTSGKKNGIT